jgi:hypothetical protein
MKTGRANRPETKTIVPGLFAIPEKYNPPHYCAARHFSV